MRTIIVICIEAEQYAKKIKFLFLPFNYTCTMITMYMNVDYLTRENKIYRNKR